MIVGRQIYGDKEQISGHWGTGMGGKGTNKEPAQENSFGKVVCFASSGGQMNLALG